MITQITNPLMSTILTTLIVIGGILLVSAITADIYGMYLDHKIKIKQKQITTL